MDTKEMRHQDLWKGKYKGIAFEIIKWAFRGHPKENWNYYLYLNKQSFTDDVVKVLFLNPVKLKDRLYESYKYSDIPYDFQFHGGITYYETMTYNRDIVKIGCDYMHAWDEGNEYNEQRIYHDVKRTIDAIYDLITDIKMFCTYDGVYRSTKEGIFDEYGDFRSHQGRVNFEKQILTRREENVTRN